MNRKKWFLCVTAAFLLMFGHEAHAQKSIYVPQQVKDGGSLDNTESQWCWERSIQGDDIIIFWEKGYGTNNPNSSAVPADYRVDVDDMLAKLEGFYDLNINQLKFATIGKDSSYLDKYKMVILLYYTTEWMAYGSGFDNTIGGMWVSPSTCHPVGATIAHEIGHSFQYQIYCDYLLNHPAYNSDTKSVAFQYTIGQKGNGFWESTAQWQACQAYPESFFGDSNYGVFRANCYRQPYHEWQRYANYFILEWFAHKHGIDTPSRIWHECRQPEDASQTYMRLFYGSSSTHIAEFSDEMYDMAAHWVTWDIPSLRTQGQAHIGDMKTLMNRMETNSEGQTIWQVDSANCVQEHGFNHIELNVPENGGEVTVNFKGVAGAAGYNKALYQNAGWKYGFVALLDNGERVYSTPGNATYAEPADTATFNVPTNTARLWLVILGAPKYYQRHEWDEDASNDEQWPYQVSFQNTNLLGEVDFNGSEVAHDATIVYDVQMPVSTSAYEALTIGVDPTPVCKAFVMKKDEIVANLGKYSSAKRIKFYNVNASGNTVSGYTTNTTDNLWGGWFTIAGNLCTYGSTSMAYCDFVPSDLTFTLGRYPNRAVVGQTCTLRQALILDGKQRVTFQFNITFVPSTTTASATRTQVIVDESTGIAGIVPDGEADTNSVFDLNGRNMGRAIQNLPKGIYIVNGKKISVR